jgi:hypothetical protein
MSAQAMRSMMFGTLVHSDRWGVTEEPRHRGKGGESAFRRHGLTVSNVLRLGCVLAIPWVVVHCDSGDAQYWGGVLLALFLVIAATYVIHWLTAPPSGRDDGIDSDDLFPDRSGHVSDSSPGGRGAARHGKSPRLRGRHGLDH